MLSLSYQKTVQRYIMKMNNTKLLCNLLREDCICEDLYYKKHSFKYISTDIGLKKEISTHNKLIIKAGLNYNYSYLCIFTKRI